MSKIIILIICASLEMVAQIKVPNGGFEQFETISNNDHRYDSPISWKEHRKNNAQRLEDGNGFVYKYDLPDANGTAIALHRGSSRSYITEDNSIFTSFLIPKDHKNIKLVGRYKFSGSDIDQAIDTLKVVAFFSPEQLKRIPTKIPQNAVVLDLVVPTSQFEWFHLDVNKMAGNDYLAIVIQLKSGSDDSYYWGYSNAVIDDLKFVTNQSL